MPIKLTRWEKHEQIRTATEKMKHCLIFSREIFCRNKCFMFKYSITHNMLLLRKHDVTEVCSMEYLSTEIELVLPTFKSRVVNVS